MDLKDKVAVVTGTSRGIGKAMVLALLEKGVKVAGWNRTDPGINDPNFLFVATDVSDEQAVELAHKATTDKFGEIDVLVNNAGLGYFSRFDDLPFNDWKQMFDVNVHGLFLCTKAVLPAMRKAHAGHIVNISSIAGLNGVNQAAGYCGTKHAVRGIGHSLYLEVKKDNIKVTNVYPGSVHTNFFDKVDGIKANDTMLHPEDVAKLILNVLEQPDNFNTLDLEIRPMNPSYS